MTIRFLADEDLHGDIVTALRLREPTLYILDVKHSLLRGLKDDQILKLAAEQGRIVVSHDRRTMTRAFRERQAEGEPDAGLLIVPQRGPIGEIVE